MVPEMSEVQFSNGEVGIRIQVWYSDQEHLGLLTKFSSEYQSVHLMVVWIPDMYMYMYMYMYIQIFQYLNVRYSDFHCIFIPTVNEKLNSKVLTFFVLDPVSLSKSLILMGEAVSKQKSQIWKTLIEVVTIVQKIESVKLMCEAIG